MNLDKLRQRVARAEWSNHRYQKVAETLVEVADCAQEICDVLSDKLGRDEVDSFTSQPLVSALAALAVAIEKMP